MVWNQQPEVNTLLETEFDHNYTYIEETSIQKDQSVMGLTLPSFGISSY